MTDDKTGHSGQAKKCNSCIKRVGGCNPEPGDDPVEPPVRYRAMDAQKGDRTYRSGKGKADDDSLNKQAEIHVAPDSGITEV